MNAPLHFNLLKESEMLSSSPVRIRVMMPLLALLVNLGLVVWLLLLGLRREMLGNQIRALEERVAARKDAYEDVLRLVAQEKEEQAVAQQLAFVRGGVRRYAEFLGHLPACVPAAMQLTELRIPLPPAPPPLPAGAKAPAQPAGASATNSAEKVAMSLAGRVAGDRPDATISTLLEALRAPGHGNFILSAAIPPGAFRQDTSKDTSARETSIFTISCDCGERRFQ